MTDTFENPDVMTAAAQGRLRTIIERAEKFNEDKAAVMADLKELFSEAKSSGYCPKALKAVIKRRAADKAKLQEEEAILDTYLVALGEV